MSRFEHETSAMDLERRIARLDAQGVTVRIGRAVGAELEAELFLASDQIRLVPLVQRIGGQGAGYEAARAAFAAGFSRSPRQFLGMEWLAHDSQAFQVLKNEISNLREWSHFPEVSPSQIGRMERLSVGGLGNDGVFRAKLLDGRDVIVKISSPTARTEGDLLAEARNTLILNKLGVGAEFHGVIRFGDGRYGLVNEFIEGVAFPIAPNRSLPPGFRFAESMATEMEQTGILIARAGYRYAPDFQFMLTPRGRAVLIDPEFFRFEVPARPIVRGQNGALPHQAVANGIDQANVLRGLIRRQPPPTSGGNTGGLIFFLVR
jgi:hypothetical protein